MAVEQKRMTYSEFEQFIAAPENDARRFELVDGQLVEADTSQLRGRLCARVAGLIYTFDRQASLGRYAVKCYHKMPDDDYNALRPDVSFTSNARTEPINKEGPVQHMPDLAVEIKGWDTSIIGMRKRAAYYIANGARMVWLVYPDKHFIEIYQPGVELQILTENDTIDGGDVLPGFTLPVREVFDV